MPLTRLHPDTIDEVKQRVDIVDVISEHVVLRKRGKDFFGSCPFHEEKSPSFTVSPSKQMYYCFGCAAGGSAINFLMELGKRSFTEVVLDLARRYQVSVKTLEPEQQQEIQRRISLQEQLYEILAVTASFYQHALRQSQGEIALNYLLQQRRLREETIQQFQLGYAPAGWETLYRYLVDQKGFSVKLVEQAGLVKPKKSGDGYIDMFRDRLIIPIADTQGRIIGFGGRTLSDEQPKYLNSPETELFNKGKTLFGLDRAKSAIAKQDSAVVVEGYFDAIALHSAGINHTVASLGTALSIEQVKLLLRYTESKQIILNFDADAAGIKASERAISAIANLAYRGEAQLRVLNLPEGKDADEFLHHSSAEEYQQLLLNAPLWLDWQIAQLLKDRDLKQADQYQQTATEMIKLLGNITSDHQLTHYLHTCAELLSLDDFRRVQLLENNFLDQVVRHWAEQRRQNPALAIPLLVENRLKQNKQFSPRRASSPAAIPVTSEQNQLEEAESLLLQIYLHSPEFRQEVVDALEERDVLFNLPHHRFLWQQILALPADLPGLGEGNSNQLISLLQEKLLQFPEEFKKVKHLFYLDEKQERDRILRAPLLIRAAIASLEKVEWEKYRRHCLEEWHKIDEKIDPKGKQRYLQEFYNAEQRVKELEQERQFRFSEITRLFYQ
jgi:DNA primase